jgi:hypothetical protein
MTYSRPSLVKPPTSLVRIRSARGATTAAGRRQARVATALQGWDLRFGWTATLQLLQQAAATVDDDDARDGLQQQPVLRGDLVGGPHEDATRTVDHVGFDPGRDQAHDFIVELLAVAGLILGPDHQVNDQAFHAPVRACQQQLPDEADLR